MYGNILAALLAIVEARDPFLNKAKPYSQDFYDNYNILKYTAWEGPYSQRRGVGINRDTPTGCRVDQVAMLHRHGERFPDSYDAGPEYEVWRSIVDGHDKFEGVLEFLNWWTPIASEESGWDGVSSSFGAYAGTLGAYSNGVDYRRRYNHLYDPETILPIFASGYERVVTTARKFGQGFLGFNYTELAAVQIIPEGEDQGANTIATGYCEAGFDSPTQCEMPSDEDLENWSNGWIPDELENAAKRLNHFHTLNLTGLDVRNLMATAAFEINIRGDSPWIQVFSSEEWVAFEYYESAYYYCFYGPQANATPYRGSVYLNATRTLLNQGPEETLPLAFSFGHDTDITALVTLLGFANVSNFDPKEVAFGLAWDVADIVPQSAHIVFERLIYEEPEYLSDFAWQESEFANAYPLAFNSTNNSTLGYNSTINSTALYAANYTYPMGSNKTDPLYYRNLTSNGTFINGTATNGTYLNGTYSNGTYSNSTQSNSTYSNSTYISSSIYYANYTSNGTYANSSVADSYEYAYGEENIYIRVVLNDAVVPLPGCSSGPGKSCKLSDFNKLVDAAIEGYDYFSKCIEPVYPDAPRYLDFFWTWNQTNINDYDPTVIPYQAGLVDYLGEPVE